MAVCFEAYSWSLSGKLCRKPFVCAHIRCPFVILFRVSLNMIMYICAYSRSLGVKKWTVVTLLVKLVTLE